MGGEEGDDDEATTAAAVFISNNPSLYGITLTSKSISCNWWPISKHSDLVHVPSNVKTWCLVKVVSSRILVYVYSSPEDVEDERRVDSIDSVACSIDTWFLVNVLCAREKRDGAILVSRQSIMKAGEEYINKKGTHDVCTTLSHEITYEGMRITWKKSSACRSSDWS